MLTRMWFLCILLLATVTGTVSAETKLTFPQRESVKRQTWNMNEVDKKLPTVANKQDVDMLNAKLKGILDDLAKNKCPDDNPEVTVLKDRVAKASEALKAKNFPEAAPVVKATPAPKDTSAPQTVEKNTPAPATPKNEPKAEPKKQEVKLPPNQRDAIKRQEYNLGKIEAELAGFKEAAEKAKLYPRKVPAGLGLTNKLDGILDDLKRNNCPEDHPQVAALLKRTAELRNEIPLIEKTLQEKYAAFDKLANPGNYPDLEKDLGKLKELNNKYKTDKARGITQTGTGWVDKAVSRACDFKTDAEYFNALIQKYDALIKLKNVPAADTMNYNLAQTSTTLKEYVAFKEDFVKSLPDTITRTIDSAMSNLQRAKTENKPGFVSGVVAKDFENAKKFLDGFAKIKGDKDPEVVKLNELYAQKTKEKDTIAKAWEEDIIAATTLPEDVYKGADRDDMINKVRAEWKKLFPKDEILAIRCHMEEWDRDVRNTWDGASKSWEFTDKSVLCVSVVVKLDDKYAMIYPAYLNRNNLTNAIKVGADTKGAGYVQTKMLLQNTK